MNAGADGDKFYHLGIADYGSDWIQDYNAADGDVLFYGGAGAATASDFLIQRATTGTAGADDVDEFLSRTSCPATCCGPWLMAMQSQGSTFKSDQTCSICY